MSKPRVLDLPHGYQAIIDEDDWPLAQKLALYRGSNGYVYYSTWANGKSTPRTLHSLLLGSVSGQHIDHINGDKLDNRRDNLRVVSPSKNQANRHRLNKNNSSGVRGVVYRPNLSPARPWRAQIMHNRKAMHLGLFSTQEEAVAARQAAEIHCWGEVCPVTQW